MMVVLMEIVRYKQLHITASILAFLTHLKVPQIKETKFSCSCCKSDELGLFQLCLPSPIERGCPGIETGQNDTVSPGHHPLPQGLRLSRGGQGHIYVDHHFLILVCTFCSATFKMQSRLQQRKASGKWQVARLVAFMIS